MQIIGNKDDVNVITLRHKGKDIKFRCYSNPLPYMPRTDLEEDREAEIVFDDMREIENMILMLESFMTQCTGYIGCWG